MKTIVASLLIVVIGFALGCGTAPAPEGQAPDDIVPAPGLGPTYRANIQEQGIENPWLPIKSTEVVLGSTGDTARITYRDNIETKAGQARNNIFWIYLPGSALGEERFQQTIGVNLVAMNLPAGITFTKTDEWHGPDPGRQIKQYIRIEIPASMKPGEYTFEVRIEINGEDYGQVPCTLKVIG